MNALERHEEFEMRVLDEMRKARVLDHLIFGGGTMLRLCFDLPRYSVDLDFYLKEAPSSFGPHAARLTEAFRRIGAEITDVHEKHFSFLWEIRLAPYPRKLKLEVRKKAEESTKTELNIAHSPFSPLQVRLRTLTLPQMWQNKIAALLDRREIRDAYDLEFLTRRGIGDFRLVPNEKLKKIADHLISFTAQDFKVKLGSVLNSDERELVLSNRFSYLKSKIHFQ